MRRDPFNPSGGLVVGQPTILLAGVMLQTMLVPSSKTSGEASLPPLHLGVGVSIQSALDVIRSPEAKRTRDKVLSGST